MNSKLIVEGKDICLLTGEVVPFESAQCQLMLENFADKFIYQRNGFKITCRAIGRNTSQNKYWEAYKKIGGKVKKKYLGRSEALSIELLSKTLDYFEELYNEYKRLNPPKTRSKRAKEVDDKIEEKRYTVSELRKILESKNLKKSGRSYKDKKRLIDELE